MSPEWVFLMHLVPTLVQPCLVLSLLSSVGAFQQPHSLRSRSRALKRGWRSVRHYVLQGREPCNQVKHKQGF